MYSIKCVNKIAKIGLQRFDTSVFNLEDSASPDGLLVRSASLHEEALPPSVLAIARAGAGVNNIPLSDCAEKGIVVFNTPGANANAVRELAVCALFLASRDIYGGITWARTLADQGDQVPALVEKGKAAYAGPEIAGKTLGVIGLGAIGVGVANAGHHLGMDVIGYDPYISVDAAWGLSRSVRRCHDLKALLSECDYISLHVPLNPNTKGMINADTLALARDGLRILNFARAELVNDTDVLAALDSGKVARYITDFPTAAVVAHPSVVPIPHLGASTPESEDNCAVMAVDQLADYLRFGNIKNAVNYPDVDLPWVPGPRLCVAHKNVPSILSTITECVAEYGVNIENMINKSKKEYAYTLLDTTTEIPPAVAAKLATVPAIIRVRIIAE